MPVKNIANNCCCVRPILPLTYNESLSYMEDLCGLIAKMNEIINFINGNIEEQLKEYIDKEFNNMMMNAMYDPETETLSLYLRKVG